MLCAGRGSAHHSEACSPLPQASPRLPRADRWPGLFNAIQRIGSPPESNKGCVTSKPEVGPGQKSASGKSAADYRGDSFRATDKPEAILKLALMVQHPRRFSRGTVKTSRRTLPVLSVREG
jgi:hypothetical protein